MVVFGISVYLWAMVFMSVWYVSHEYDRIKKSAKRGVVKHGTILKQLKSKKAAELPPAFREENWMRNIYGEPRDLNAILASTGCELTDAIFAAADKSGIDIRDFYDQFEKDQSEIHCNDSCIS